MKIGKEKGRRTTCTFDQARDAAYEARSKQVHKVVRKEQCKNHELRSKKERNEI